MALQAADMCSAGAADRLFRRDIGIWTPLTSAVPFSDWRRAAKKGGRPDLFGLRMKVLKDEKSSCSLPPSNPAWEMPLWNLDTNLLTKPSSITYRSVGDHGSNFRIAYQGSPGAFSEAAALKAYPHCEAVPCEHFEVTFEAVELWLVDKAILPIENSLHGSYHRNHDLLLQHRLHIVREVQIPVDHCLMALPGVSKKDLKRVVSHPQALGQCENSLIKLGVTKESFHDTAGAAQMIASKGLRDAGAIASAQAAKLYGLHILQHKMQDACNNVTRFLVLAREPIIPLKDRPFKTSIVFILEDGPGALFKALAVFVLRGINLSKIESRPQRKQPLRVVDDSDHGTAKYFHFFFYIDFEASMAESRAQSALTNLQEFVSFLRVLGSFPMDTTL